MAQNNYWQQLESIEPGAEAVIEKRSIFGGRATYHKGTVTKVTKTQITILPNGSDPVRFTKGTGSQVGGSKHDKIRIARTAYGPNRVESVMLTWADVDQIEADRIAKIERQNLAYKVEAAVKERIEWLTTDQLRAILEIVESDQTCEISVKYD